MAGAATNCVVDRILVCLRDAVHGTATQDWQDSFEMLWDLGISIGFKFTYWVHVCRIMVVASAIGLRNLSLMSFMPSWQLWWKTCDHSKVVTNASHAHIMNPFRESIPMVTGRQGISRSWEVELHSCVFLYEFCSMASVLPSETMATWILDKFSTSIEMALSPSGEIRVPNAS